ncbi:GMC family oxidoreductase N-terminal domain-containing protein [Glutamicibacter sp. FR1]|uniref:GMC family oxidoreductase N-terminal domain-containing protein n=1 Tax=Glutamicibacter sp. FR1 TaxID=3393744 RepID=UPI0039B02BD8
MLGGSHVLHATIWVRCAPQDYDGWAKDCGEQWAWKNVLPIYKDIENSSPAAPASSTAPKGWCRWTTTTSWMKSTIRLSTRQCSPASSSTPTTTASSWTACPRSRSTSLAANASTPGRPTSSRYASVLRSSPTPKCIR